MHGVDPRTAPISSGPMTIYQGEENEDPVPQQTVATFGPEQLQNMLEIFQKTPFFQEIVLQTQEFQVRTQALEIHRENADRKIDDQEQEIERLKNENNGLRQRNVILENSQSESKEKIRELFDDLKELGSSNECHKKEIGRLKADKDEQSKKVVILLGNTKALSEENKRLELSYSALSAKHKQARLTIDRARKELHGCHAACDDLRRKLMDEQFESGLEAKLQEWTPGREDISMALKWGFRLTGFGLGRYTSGAAPFAIELLNEWHEKEKAVEWRALKELVRGFYTHFKNSEVSDRNKELEYLVLCEAKHAKFKRRPEIERARWQHLMNHHNLIFGGTCAHGTKGKDCSKGVDWSHGMSKEDFIAEARKKYPPYQDEISIEDVWRHLELKFKHAPALEIQL